MTNPDPDDELNDITEFNLPWWISVPIIALFVLACIVTGVIIAGRIG